VKSYTFKKELIKVDGARIGRVSRQPGDFPRALQDRAQPARVLRVEDLGSANGTYLNDELIQREPLMNNDVLRAGKFSLWVNYEEDRGLSRGPGARLPPLRRHDRSQHDRAGRPHDEGPEQESDPAEWTPEESPRAEVAPSRRVWAITLRWRSFWGRGGAGVVWLMLG